jgi:hypothetical protein
MAENCTDCDERTPVVPTYSKAVPILNDNCGDCDEDNAIFTPPLGSSGSGKTTEISAGDSISVDSSGSDSLVDRFVIAYAPAVQLSVVLTLKDVGDAAFAPVILNGTIVAVVKLSWVYNRPSDIASQTLLNDGGLTPPSLGTQDVSFNYLAESIGSNITFTVTGDDGQALPTSIGLATGSLTFGNYRTWGVGARKDQGATTATAMVTFIEGLMVVSDHRDLTTNRVKTLTGEGATVYDYDYYAYPAAWGFATFLQNGNPGGWKRLADVAGTIVVASGDSLEAGENPLMIDNGLTSESYFVYQSGAGQAI